MHLCLKKQSNSLIHDTFQGILRIETQNYTVSEANSRKVFDSGKEINGKKMPFLYLSLDLPPAPLFQDELEKNIIPQVSIQTLLAKYDGETGQV